jgi:molybdate transport system substrate-binding protein
MKEKKFIFLVLASLVLFCSGCDMSSSSGAGAVVGSVSSPKPVTLTVMAAASLTESFTEIGDLFEAQNPGVTVAFSFAGSQQLAQQLADGAPADVFASANQKYMDLSLQDGRVQPGSQAVFAKNRLVAITPINNPAGLHSLSELARPGLKLVLAAKEVPVGQYSLEFLDKASQNPQFGPSYKEAMLGNVVSYEDNVKTVLAKVSLDEADAGIVYSSDLSLGAAGKVLRIEIPDELNVIAFYPIAPINDSSSPELAGAFIDLVLSPQGQQIMAKYNFIPVIP